MYPISFHVTIVTDGKASEKRSSYIHPSTFHPPFHHPSIIIPSITCVLIANLPSTPPSAGLLPLPLSFLPIHITPYVRSGFLLLLLPHPNFFITILAQLPPPSLAHPRAAPILFVSVLRPIFNSFGARIGAGKRFLGADRGLGFDRVCEVVRKIDCSRDWWCTKDYVEEYVGNLID